MSRNLLSAATLFLALSLTGCQGSPADIAGRGEGLNPSAPSSTAAMATEPAPAVGGPVTDWALLMPEDARVLRPPPIIRGTGMRGPQDLGGLIDDNGSGTPPGMVIDHSSPNRAQQFGSSEVVPELENRNVSLRGYVVPLESDDAGRVRELLFVPFYGACIHVPPPPPNQIIRVVLDEPIDLPDLQDPFEIEGTLHIAKFDADIASASYQVKKAKLTLIGQPQEL